MIIDIYDRTTKSIESVKVVNPIIKGAASKLSVKRLSDGKLLKVTYNSIRLPERELSGEEGKVKTKPRKKK